MACEELLILTKKYINLEDTTPEEDRRRDELWRRYINDAKTFSLVFSKLKCCRVCDAQELTLKVYTEILLSYDKKGYGFNGRFYADKALTVHRKTEQNKCIRSHL